MERITKSAVEAAFRRLHRAMNWSNEPPYKNGKPNIGAIYLADNGMSCFAIEQICTEGGGVYVMFPSWQSKREAFNTMAAMAGAVEEYKREH